MKKKLLIADIIVLLLKVIIGYFNSYALLGSGLFDLLLIIVTILSSSKKDNNGFKNVISFIISLLFVGLSISLAIYSFIDNYKIPSLLLVLLLLIFLMTRYSINCFYTSSNYKKKSGLLYISNRVSNYDFYNYGIIIVVIIVSHISKWFKILTNADRVGCILICLLVLYRCFKIVVHHFKKIKELSNDVINEVSKREEVKVVDKVTIKNFGGFRNLTIRVKLRENLDLVTLNSFMVTLSDYLLKYVDVANVVMSNEVRSSSNARNSGSRNSKKSTKRKNNRKKNK